MNLLLWRHAAAEDATRPSAAADLARPLTRRGHRQAALVADWLRSRLPAQYTLIASPAVRTRETAAALSTGVTVIDTLAPGATARAVLAAAGWPDRADTVIVVGHQPTLGRAAALALTGHELPLAVSKGSVWWLSSRDRDEGTGVVLRAVMAPGMLE